MSIGKIFLDLVDRPLSVLVALMIGLGTFLIAPTVDRAIPILRDIEVSEPIWTVPGEIGWTVDLCRARSGPHFLSIQYSVHPANGATAYPLRGVRDITDNVEEQAPLQLAAGACLPYTYAVEIAGQAVSGDTIVGTAIYKSGVGWWFIYEDYGALIVPQLPELLPTQGDYLIQQQLEAIGQGIEELRK